MSNKLTKEDRALVQHTLDFISGVSEWSEAINIWKNGNPIYKERILTSLKRQMNRNAGPSLSLGLDGHFVVLITLMSHLLIWMNDPPIRISERKKIIKQIGSSAANIIRDMERIGLPMTSTRYFTDDEIQQRYRQIFEAIGSNSNFHPPSDLNEVKQWLGTSESYTGYQEAVDLTIAEVLVKLTDQKLLDSLAWSTNVTKTNSENYKRIFLIRKTTEYFFAHYGEGLQETTAIVCALLLDDESIDRDTVRAALAGLKRDPKYKQPSFTFQRRFAAILGPIKSDFLGRPSCLRESEKGGKKLNKKEVFSPGKKHP